MSTKEQPGHFDGLERAEPDEPVFPLRAHDDLAVGLVREWVFQRRQAIVRSGMTDEKRTLELIHAREAESVADAMEEWRAGVAAAAPDEPEKPSHKAAPKVLDADEMAAKTWFDANLAASRRFDNAIAEVAEAADTLAEYGFDRDGIDIAAGLIRIAADSVRPKRASYAHRGE